MDLLKRVKSIDLVACYHTLELSNKVCVVRVCIGIEAKLHTDYACGGEDDLFINVKYRLLKDAE